MIIICAIFYKVSWSFSTQNSIILFSSLAEFITEQIESIERLESYLTKLNRCGKGLGEFLFDKELRNDGGSVH